MRPGPCVPWAGVRPKRMYGMRPNQERERQMMFTSKGVRLLGMAVVLASLLFAAQMLVGEEGVSTASADCETVGDEDHICRSIGTAHSLPAPTMSTMSSSYADSSSTISVGNAVRWTLITLSNMAHHILKVAILGTPGGCIHGQGGIGCR